MEKALHQELINKITQLKAFVSGYSTVSLIGTVAAELRKALLSGHDGAKLVSPAKQCFYLIGILLTTKEPSHPKTLDISATKKLIESLNEVFQFYAHLFWPTEDEKDNLSDEWYRCREVAMPAFLHYFNTSLMASIEQVVDRIREELMPFDNIVAHDIGLSIETVLKVADVIAKHQQQNLENLYSSKEREMESRSRLLDKAQREDWSLERLRKDPSNSEYREYIIGLLRQIDELFAFDSGELLVSQTEIDYFLDTFSLKRDGSVEFTYLTETNPAELKPIVHYEGSKYFCPSINALYVALLKKFEEVILSSDSREKYLKHRDNVLESKSERLFLSLVSKDSKAYGGLYETEDLQYEHDTIIVSGRNLYILESKASPPLEPFRDPEKAYTRIKRHFHSSKGIQKGFEQAERIRYRLTSEANITLYDKRTNPALVLRQNDFDNVFCVCITRDDYGPLATNLNLLLEKEEDTPFPWVINVLDFEFLIQGFKHLGLGESDLVNYLNSRLKLHGKLFGTDELEYVGFYLKHGGLEEIVSKKADLIVLAPQYSDIFDEIFVAEKIGEKIEVAVAPPVMVNAREAIFGIDNLVEPVVKFKGKYSKSKEKRKRKISKRSRRKNR